MIDLNEMAIFVAVVEQGSFTKAADRLDVPLSSISRRLAQLEERLSVRLIQRTTRKLQLTDIGATYYNHCKRVVEEAESAEFTVRELQSEPCGTIRIVTPISFDSSFASTMLSSFLKRYPKVSLDMVQSSRDVDLIEEQFDCAFCLGPLTNSSLISRGFGSFKAILCASPEYLEEHGTPKHLEELHTHTLIRLPLLEWEFDRVDKGVDLNFSFRTQTNEISMVRQFVADGCGIGFLPTIHMADQLATGKIVQILPEYYNEKDFYLVYPSNRQISTKLRCFIDHSVEICQQSAPWEFN